MDVGEGVATLGFLWLKLGEDSLRTLKEIKLGLKKEREEETKLVDAFSEPGTWLLSCDLVYSSQ